MTHDSSLSRSTAVICDGKGVDEGYKKKAGRTTKLKSSCGSIGHRRDVLGRLGYRCITTFSGNNVFCCADFRFSATLPRRCDNNCNNEKKIQLILAKKSQKPGFCCSAQFPFTCFDQQMNGWMQRELIGDSMTSGEALQA